MPTGTPTKSKKCSICGKQFLPKSPAQRMCDEDHYKPCPVCGKPVLWNTTKKDVKPCSKECSRILRRKRNMDKYGVEHPMQLKEVQEKHRASVKEHFGVEHPLQSQEVKNKAIETNREKFGADWALGSKKFHEKCSDAMKRKYGYRTTFESPELMTKAKSTMAEKYGVQSPVQCNQIRQKMEQTNLQRYGVKHPMQNPSVSKRMSDTRKQHGQEIAKHIRQAFQERYGVDSCRQSPIVVNKIKQSLIKHYGVDAEFKSDDIKQRAMEANMEKYEVPWHTLTDACKQGRQYVETSNNVCVSNINKKFANRLSQAGIEHVQFELKLDGKFFDICLPDSKTLIEIDPSYTHNTEGLNHFNKVIDANYHLEKTRTANENGYRCIHVFDWDDWNKVVQLVLPTKRIYARNCQIVKIVNYKVAKKFISDNHLQGQARGALLTLGLVCDDELVECMSFGKSRYNKKYTYELLRLCSKQGVSVIGGASKLFKFATQELELDSIISYCDASKFTGKVYQRMGMTLVNETKPAIVWSKEDKRITSNLLRQRGYDQLFNSNYGKGTDNEILMLANGWLPVPDCGQKVFEYKC